MGAFKIKLANGLPRFSIALVLLMTSGCDNTLITPSDSIVTPTITSVTLTNPSTLTLRGSDLMGIDQVVLDGDTVSYVFTPTVLNSSIITISPGTTWTTYGVVTGQTYKVTAFDQDTNNAATAVFTFP